MKQVPRKFTLTLNQVLLVILLVVTGVTEVSAADELPAIFSDHMVLQRDRPFRIWGRSPPGTQIGISFADHHATTQASESRHWEVEMPPLPASSTGRPLVIKAEQTHRFEDVVVGDVWLFSGQSNMNWPLELTHEATAELADADLRDLRLFNVGRLVADAPDFGGRGSWQPSSPDAARKFSAIAFLVGRGLSREYGVPVGVIQSTWGGTRIRVWMPKDVLAATPRFRFMLDDWERELADFPRLEAEFEANLPALTAEWERAVALAKEKGRSPPYPPQLRTGAGTRYQPGGLYAGMIAPLAPYAMKGVAWYQGESDPGQAELYAEMLSALIESWRMVFRDERLPFVVVQLPNLRRGREPTGGRWPVIREAQLQVAQTVAHVALVTTIDVGDPADVHARFKQPVAARVQAAFGVIAQGAGDPGERLAPVPAGLSVNAAGEVTIRFSPRGVELVASNPVPGLVIAGADRRFVTAHWRIEGGALVAWSPAVAQPASVRYAWGGNPVAGFFNKTGIPMSPFRLDDWADDSVVYTDEALTTAFKD